MTEFKNMKIEINENQPLDDVVRELERLGYSSTGFPNVINPTESIRTVRHEKYQNIKKFEFLAWHINAIDELWKLTTLAELKSMNIDHLKEM